VGGLRLTVLESSPRNYAVFGALRTSYRELPGILMCVYIRVYVGAGAPQVIAPPSVGDGATAGRLRCWGWRWRLSVVRDVRSVLAGIKAEGGERGDGDDGGDTKHRGGMYFLLARTTAAKLGAACVLFWRGPRRRRQGWHVFLLARTTAAKVGTACFSFGGDHGGGGGDGMCCCFLTGTTAAEVGTACFYFGRDHGSGGGDGK
jgi:hypothetical protein